MVHRSSRKRVGKRITNGEGVRIIRLDTLAQLERVVKKRKVGVFEIPDDLTGLQDAIAKLWGEIANSCEQYCIGKSPNEGFILVELKKF